MTVPVAVRLPREVREQGPLMWSDIERFWAILPMKPKVCAWCGVSQPKDLRERAECPNCGGPYDG